MPISQKVSKISIRDMSLNTTLDKLLSEAGELKHFKSLQFSIGGSHRMFIINGREKDAMVAMVAMMQWIKSLCKETIREFGPHALQI